MNMGWRDEKEGRTEQCMQGRERQNERRIRDDGDTLERRLQETGNTSLWSRVIRVQLTGACAVSLGHTAQGQDSPSSQQ